MSFDWSFKDYFNLSRRIPLRYQKRYLTNISNGSFNASVLTGVYKKKIKKLSENNRLLALALQNDRVQKEELLVESKANADLVLFSRLKLTNMYKSLKTAVSVLDEALSLLEMHSSKSIFKCTPKNTVVKEDFKEQIKEVTMATIPEEDESPGNDICKNTKGATYRFFSKKHSKQPNLNRIEQNMNENSSQINTWNEMVSTLKEYEFTDNEVIKNNFFLKKKPKNTYSRKRTQKSRPKASNRSTEGNLNKKGNEISGTLQLRLNQVKDNAKIDCMDNSAEKNGIAKSDTLSLNSEQNNLCGSTPHEQNLSSKGENSSEPSRSNNKTELHDTIENSRNHKVTSNSLKSNSNEKMFYNTQIENLSNKDLKNPNVRKHALKNISSKINIENSKLDKMKRKSAYSLDSLTSVKEKEIKRVKSVCSLDDFTFTEREDKDVVKKRKSTLPISRHIKKCNRKILFKENVSPLPETSKLSIDLISQSESSGQEKEVKNLTKNLSLVSIPKIPIVSGIAPKTNILQPDVNDLFKAHKSFCKNTSSLSFIQANKIKAVAEDSFHTQNENSVYSDSGVGKSVDQDKKETSSKTELNIEPPLLDVVNIKQMNEDKKNLRKRQSIICYREPPTNTKLRR